MILSMELKLLIRRRTKLHHTSMYRIHICNTLGEKHTEKNHFFIFVFAVLVLFIFLRFPRLHPCTLQYSLKLTCICVSNKYKGSSLMILYFHHIHIQSVDTIFTTGNNRTFVLICLFQFCNSEIIGILIFCWIRQYPSIFAFITMTVAY